AGSTAVTADAIEWSLDPTGDGSMEGQADVINMSLGSLWGDPNDPSALASQNATEVGTVVVSSAGNSGHNAAYVTGSPAVAPGA
ncbi:MAG: S8 family serine peptidase, partial [Actinobacteria bacterium]|nr:S8 family serine peptidase [Actinomycetota bacterium]NIS28618.1 S8 family serine peptidase [Actinomycetota bacterium]NIU64079.1 S8 family serine peptidase [Actinomycetota bacterium]NIW25884.1 S8 family serine peptidase [Actinomycetota bacterium]NIX18476.1 S8 family serine peptidase [Actinomycetota bacterium]